MQESRVCHVGSLFGAFSVCVPRVRLSVVLRSHYILRKAAFNSVFPSVCGYFNCLIYKVM